MNKTLLNLISINKYFDNSHILKDISLDIKDGEFLTLLGPSGCGKTTILRCIAGLERIDSGDILLNGESIKDQSSNKRNVNTVFQNYALFPHLNIYDNIAYGPRIKKSMGEEELKNRVYEVLDLVQMLGYEERMTHQLSGGQRQRIAIARALINQPDILLLDEPLGALDLKLRKYMQSELAELQKQTKTTFVYVTHDQEEALNMSDRIVVLNKGVVQQVGTPREIYNYPNNLFVADFIGDRNIKQVKVLDRQEEYTGKVKASEISTEHTTKMQALERKESTKQVQGLESGEEYSKIMLGNNLVHIPCRNNRTTNDSSNSAILAIHTDKMRISCSEIPNSLSGTILSVHYAGSQIRTEIDVDGEKITVIEYQNNDCEYDIGDKVYVSWEESGAILLPMEDEFEERSVSYEKI